MGRKKRKIPGWLQAPIYLAIRGAMTAAMLGEVEPTVNAARTLARLYAELPFNRARLRRAMEHIALAFPDWDEERRRLYALKSYEHLFTLVVEASVMTRLLSEDGWPARVRLGNMAEGLRELTGVGREVGARRRASVMITAHTGNWELMGYSLALLGFPMHVLFRPLDLQPLSRWIERTRQRRGLVLVDKFGASQELPRLMDRGMHVAFVADQNGGDRGLFVPFFGRLSSAYKSIGLLALRHEAPIICGHAVRVPGWSRGHVGDDTGAMSYQLDVVDFIRPEDWADQPDPLFYVTARYRRAIETMVRRAPEQYLWMHRYWKSRPRHERLGRPMPGALKEKIAQLPWMTSDELERIVEWSERDTRDLAAARA